MKTTRTVVQRRRSPRNAFALAAVSLCLLLAPGCQTLTGSASGPYSGVRSWVTSLRLAKSVIGPSSSAGKNVYALGTFFGSAIDLPLCLALDTLLFPIKGIAYLVEPSTAGPEDEVIDTLLAGKAGGHGVK
jgi:hypothetical protein